jgi:hypothetical protein
MGDQKGSATDQPDASRSSAGDNDVGRQKVKRKEYEKELRKLQTELKSLARAPRRPCSPPQDSEDGQKRPPERVSRLIGDYRKDDADDDADHRHEVAYAYGHIFFPH